MLAALLCGALSLFVGAPAQAQTVLPVTKLSAASGNGQLTVTWNNPPGATATREVGLRWRAQGTTTWQNPGFNPASATTSYTIQNLTNGTTYDVEVRIFWGTLTAYSPWVSTTGTPRELTSVSLSASSNPMTAGEEVKVTEGLSVTVTATLSKPAASNVTIPVTVSTASPNTAKREDVGSLSSITVSVGKTSGMGKISTNLDGDTEEDNTFTVELDDGDATWPDGYVRGSPSSVPVTINDLGRTLLSSTLTVKRRGDSHLRGCNIIWDRTSMTATTTCPDALTEDTLTYNGESYRIMRLTSEGGIPPYRQIVLGFDKRVLDKEEMIPPLCLWIDGSRLCLRDARDQNKIILSGAGDSVQKVSNLYVFGWQKTPIGWTVGQQVQLRFSDDGSGTIGGGSGGGGTPGGSSGSSGPTGALGPPPGSSGSDGGVGASGGPSGPPAGGGGGGGGGLPPSGSSDEPPPEDDELSTLCSQEDRKNLERFYETTGGEQWDENENWNSEEPLNQWYGVDTDDEGEVVSLRLSENNLSGDTPEELLSCLSELKELALWGNEEDLSGEVPEELVLAVERAVLRDIAEMLNINPEWFENYGDPYNFEDWHEGVTTDDKGRVTELVLPGEVPGTLISQLRKLRVITISSENGGCTMGASQERMGASALLAVIFMMLVLSRGLRARSD